MSCRGLPLHTSIEMDPEDFGFTIDLNCTIDNIDDLTFLGGSWVNEKDAIQDDTRIGLCFSIKGTEKWSVFVVKANEVLISLKDWDIEALTRFIPPAATFLVPVLMPLRHVIETGVVFIG
jgi:hypothetical protein